MLLGRYALRQAWPGSAFCLRSRYSRTSRNADQFSIAQNLVVRQHGVTERKENRNTSPDPLGSKMVLIAWVTSTLSRASVTFFRATATTVSAPPTLCFCAKPFEHSIWGPIGFAFSADEGKVALSRNKIDFNQLAHSFSAGITYRAGGLPALSLAFAWGGPEGTHTIANVDTSPTAWRIDPSLSLFDSQLHASVLINAAVSLIFQPRLVMK